jgi:hypothetical protein
MKSSIIGSLLSIEDQMQENDIGGGGACSTHRGSE